MEKSVVVVLPCSTYDEEQVYSCMKAGIRMLGGLECFVSPSESILVKPNFLTASEADKAIVTHPSVIRGMLRLLQENGYGSVKYGDSPGHGSCRAAAEKIGLGGEIYGAAAADMSEEVKTEFPEGMTCREFWFCREAVEADAVIGLCKMKTHALERLTGAVKNMYGLVCGTRKAAGHVRFPGDDVFARQLVDIHRCVKPRLHIMDGITAMEGNGPGSGTSVAMNVMLFSADPVALDTVFSLLVDLKPEYVPTNLYGAAMGLGTCSPEEITILTAEDYSADSEVISAGELFSRFGNPDFDVPREKPKKNVLNGFSFLQSRFARRPYIDEALCVRCGMCVSHCPVQGKAVDFRNGKDAPPSYDYSKCIRCYCCQEMCPRHAIKVKGKT